MLNPRSQDTDVSCGRRPIIDVDVIDINALRPAAQALQERLHEYAALVRPAGKMIRRSTSGWRLLRPSRRWTVPFNVRG